MGKVYATTRVQMEKLSMARVTVKIHEYTAYTIHKSCKTVYEYRHLPFNLIHIHPLF